MFFFIICAFVMQSQTNETYVYQEELENLKTSAQYKIIFDKEQSLAIRELRKNIENARSTIKPTWLSKLCDGCIIVTPENMPQLYAYIETLCTKNSIAMPIVVLSTKGELYNAFATKILWSKGVVCIGKELLLDISDDTLEAVLAHELGHIKYNHVNKKLAIITTAAIASAFIAHYIVENHLNSPNKTCLFSFFGTPFFIFSSNTEREIILTQIIAFAVTSLIIGKKFEKEADAFACQSAGKAQGLIKFFTKLDEKTTNVENAWLETKALIDNNKESMEKKDYNDIWFEYYMGVGAQKLQNAMRWIYHNTPFGPHPSNEERIKAAQAYLEQLTDDQEVESNQEIEVVQEAEAA